LIFLDANVLLYAVGADHPEKASCQALLKRIAAGAVAATTSVEVVQELIFVLARRGRIADGVRVAEDVLALFPAMLPVTGADMKLACELLKRYAHLRPRDAVHVATMKNNAIGTIASSDGHFDGVPGVERVAAGDLR
jgi:hypothetical protein